jgi:hypothetical protein
MNISVVQGARDSQTLNTETRRVRDVEDMLQQLEPNEGPLTTILSRLQAETATDPKVEWFEDQLLPDFDVLGAALAAGDATMTVTNYKFFRAGDIVRVNDNEIVRVSATPTTTAVAITRGYGSVAASAAPNGARLFILSDAGAEFDTYRDQLTTQKVPKYNYIQALATPCSFTSVDLATKTFAGTDLPQEHAKAMIEHKKKMEKAFILGAPYNDTSGSHPIRTAGGLEYYIQTNVKDVSGGFTEQELEDFLRICFRYGSPEKLLLCSPKAIQSINGFGRAKLHTFADDSTYGVTLTEYKNAGRRVMLAEEKLLTNQNLNDLTGIAGHAILVDPNNVKMAYLQGNSTEMHENVQNPGVKGRIDEVRCEFGMKVFLDQTHGLLTGIND